MKGIKQETLAKQLGISQPAYCKLEKKSLIDPHRWEAILQQLDCREDEIEMINRICIK